MKVSTVRSLSVFLAIAISLAGCINNDKSLVIVGAVVPEYADDGCTYSDDPEYWFLSGEMDLNFPAFPGNRDGSPEYTVTVVVENLLLNNETSFELNGMTLQLSKAKMSYQWLAGKTDVIGPSFPNLLALEEFKAEQHMAITLESEGGTGVLPIEIIPPEIGAMLMVLGDASAENVVLGVKIQLFGTTLGGKEVESSEFLYPVRFCWGCTGVCCAFETPTIPTDDYYPYCRVGQDPHHPDTKCECDTAE